MANGSRRRGQIEARGKDKFLVRVFLGRDASGKRKYLSKTVTGSKRDAQQALTKMLGEMDGGMLVEATRATFGEYLLAWVQNRPDITPRTRAEYEHRLRLSVLPTLGFVRLDKLTAGHMNALYRSLVEEKGLAPGTVRYIHAVLRAALRDAVRWGSLGRDPSELVRLPKKPRRSPTILTPDQARTLFDATGHPRVRLRALWRLLLTSGVRPGEALALHWSDIEGHRLSVKGALTHNGKRGQLVLSDTKTAAGRRTVLVPKETAFALKVHWAEQQVEKARAGEQYEDNGLVFCTRKGKPLSPQYVSKEWRAALKKAGLPPVRLYDTRHTHASWLLAAGENPKVVQERLGHSSVKITLDTYSHVLPEIHENAARKVSAILSGKTTPVLPAAPPAPEVPEPVRNEPEVVVPPAWVAHLKIGTGK